jgi:hypothetical protein
MLPVSDRRLISAADVELAPAGETLPDRDLRAAGLRAEREVIQVALASSKSHLVRRRLPVPRQPAHSL